MEVITGRMRSGLNPDAEPYVPAAHRAVDDFSPEWWALVQSSPWFAAYWMRECFQEADLDDDDDLELPDDISDALFSFHDAPHREEKMEADEGGRREKGEVIVWGADKYWKASQGCAAERAKYAEKAAKLVSVKVSPKTIQQPR
ncbi:hypothetical protein Cni_G04555 [Canna indica]|uniref:Early response to dehydration 15-like protein n=1 Tax=Canna indica TaxID=4628 RepID=A0AAQ3JUZ7_9LILI|nr:hypothetical protein Cni_G04555 [Canna indica]